MTETGHRGSLRFNLWLPEAQQDITIQGEGGGQSRLREWVYHRGKIQSDLLAKLAQKHLHYVLRGEDASEILEQAFRLDKAAFEAWLIH